MVRMRGLVSRAPGGPQLTTGLSTVWMSSTGGLSRRRETRRIGSKERHHQDGGVELRWAGIPRESGLWLQCLCVYLETWIYFVLFFIFFNGWTKKKKNPSSCFICLLTFCFIDSTCGARYLLAGAEDKDMTASSTSLSLMSPCPHDSPLRRMTICNIFFYGSLHKIREQTERR